MLLFAWQDEVFLAVAKGDTHEENALASSLKFVEDSPTMSHASDEDRSAHSAMDLENEGLGLFLRHLGALFRKRAANFKRDKRAWVCTTILPSLFVLIGFIVATYAALQRDLDPILLTLEDYNTDGDVLLRNPIAFNNPGDYLCQPDSCAYQFPIMVSESNHGSDEVYFFCGYQARLGLPNGTFHNETYCSVSKSANIMDSVNDAGAAPEGANVTSLREVSHVIILRFLCDL